MNHCNLKINYKIGGIKMKNVKYYGRKVKGIKRKTLKADILRGVKTLNETAYTEYYGSTNNSLEFFNTVMKHDIGNVTSVKMEINPKHWYSTILTTDKGFTIRLKGLAFGYHGEGSRGAYQVLTTLGVSHQKAKRVFETRKSIRIGVTA
jgi:hypothetical protein